MVYPGRTAPVITGLNLTISPGDRVTLTGENGAGKTTLFSLLLRFIEPTAGVVDVGGTELAAIAVDRWREHVGWLPQHPTLFGWSVAENIALGRPAASRAAVEQAAALAGAAEFVSQLPHGYDTVLDERAQQLSAGQRQKIALARLFLRDAPLLLLDEPTAHLDPVSAAEIADVVTTLAANRTVLVVTHRDAALFAGSAPLGPAARVLTVADGTVAESPVPTSAVPA